MENPMKLVWRLLRQHISPLQLCGFFLANLFGMWIVMLGVQFYRDVVPLFSAEDSFFSHNFVVVSKRISSVGTVSGRSNTFSEAELADLRQQPFCTRAAGFESSQYKVSAAMSVGGATPLQTELFFEAVPDSFVEVKPELWQYTPGEQEVPVIMPRTYLAIYNFGFAQSRGLPKVSDGLAGMIDMSIFINAGGRHERFRGKIVGFSGRLNTILVPQSFLRWSNEEFEPGKVDEPSRLILEVDNPTDDAIARYVQQKGYEVEDDKLDAGKATYFLKVVISLVLLIGLLVSALSFYILMLSVYLLVQKNTTKLENLLLIGYSPARVSLPYQLLTTGLNLCVLLIAFVLLLLCRGYYMDLLALIFPQMSDTGLWLSLAVGVGIMVFVSILNALAIRRKVMGIWWRKER